MRSISVITIGALSLTGAAQAATLTIDLGNSNGYSSCTVGSCLGLDYDQDYRSASLTPDVFGNIVGYQGLIVDGSTIQPASGSHAGVPDGSESPSVDQPWEFTGGTGMHYTNAPLSKTGGAGNTISLDLTGLHLTWGGAFLGRYESLLGLYEDAAVTCQFNCGDGESYTLTYRMLLSANCVEKLASFPQL